jgi:type I restriction enzyme S subunit
LVVARKKSPFKIPLSSIGIFPSHWEISTLSRACALVTGKCITGGRVKIEEAYLISERDHRAVIARSKAEFGDILFANIGNSIGELARVESDEEFSIKNVALFKPSERVESLFLKYYLGSPAVQTYIRGNTFGSAQPFIGLGTLRGFPIPLPPLPEQKTIAHILGSLDDKIELNRRMNETLEAMAQALFKSWFVDFDPVIDNALAAGNDIPEPLKAKAAARKVLGDARKPLPEDIRQHFPCRFEFTEEMGWIPEGWEAGSIGNIAKAIGGFAFKSQTFQEKGFPVVKIKNIVGDGTVLIEGAQCIGTEDAKKALKFSLNDGDLLMAMTGATVGKIGLIVNGEKNAFLNQRVAKLVGKNIENLSSFLFCFFRDRVNFEQIVVTAGGSAQPNISSSGIESIQCVIPNNDVLVRFTEIVDLNFKKWISNRKLSKSLSNLRDTLLPKLLSGELRIPDVEKIVEEAL